MVAWHFFFNTRYNNTQEQKTDYTLQASHCLRVESPYVSQKEWNWALSTGFNVIDIFKSEKIRNWIYTMYQLWNKESYFMTVTSRWGLGPAPLMLWNRRSQQSILAPRLYSAASFCHVSDVFRCGWSVCRGSGSSSRGCVCPGSSFCLQPSSSFWLNAVVRCLWSPSANRGRQWGLWDEPWSPLHTQREGLNTLLLWKENISNQSD